jgi:membrane protein
MEIIPHILDRIRKHHNTAFSAQIAFYFFLAIFPFIIVFITTLGNMLDVDQVADALAGLQTLPSQVKTLLLDYIMVANDQHLSILSLSFLAILWATSGAYYALSHAFNMAYDVAYTPNPIVERLKGLLYTSGLALALALAIILPSLSQQIIERVVAFAHLPEEWLTIMIAIKFMLYICALGGILSVSYYIIPKQKIPYSSVWVGTSFTAIAWWIESHIFNYFIVNFSKISIIYGTLSTVAIMMFWLYTLAGTLIIGAEINAYIWEARTNKDVTK